VEAEVHWTGSLAVVVALALTAARADAQTQWDVAGTAGLFAAHADANAEQGYAEDWSNAAQGAVIAGRYLTPHLKLELEASATTRGLQYAATPIAIPGDPYPYWLVTEVRTSVRSLSGVMAWQFRDNEWVHPFVLAGVSADWDDSTVHVPQQFYRGTPAPVADSRTGERTDQHLRGVFGGGAKLYFNEQAFVRAESRLVWSPDRQHLVFRAGVGIDF
jgi:hypothetical protein